VTSARPEKTKSVNFSYPLETTDKLPQGSLLENTNLTPRALEELKKRVKRFMPTQSSESMEKENLL